MRTITIGTRGSQLALYQANKVKDELQKKYPQHQFDIKIIHTKGDIVLDVALSKIGDKGLFTKEIEQALFDKEIDIAVHSLKDMPTEQPEGLVISAVLKRAEFRDALVSNTLNSWDDIKPGHVIATSSVRRKAQILKLKPGIEVIDIRGNVNTRLKKLNEGCCDATIMAAAGLQRIGLDSYIKQVLPETIFMPAVSQGIIAIESRVDDLEITQILNSINHEKTFLAAEAERAFLGVLEGGCQLPVACYTIFSENRFTIHGLVASIDGKTSIQQQKSGAKEHAVELSKELANYLLNNGAKQILLSLKK